MSDQIRKLRDKADKLRLKGQSDKALALYEELRRLDPDNPRWPHLAGEILAQTGRKSAASACYVEAAEKYLERGFGVQAVALAKMALDGDPDAEEARRILRKLSKSSHQRTALFAVESLPRSEVLAPASDRGASVRAGGRAAGGGAAVQSRSAKPPPVPSRAHADKADKNERRRKVKLHSGETLDGLRLRDVIGSSQEMPAIDLGSLGEVSAEQQAADRIRAMEDAESELSIVRAVSAFEVPIVEDIEGDEARGPNSDFAGGLAPSLLKPARREDLQVVERTPLFGDLDPETLERFISRSKVVRIPAGYQVMREGDHGKELYVVVRGSLDVVKEGPPRVVVGTIEEGSFFGEIAIVTDLPRQASVYARTDSVLLEIGRDLVVELIEEHPEVVSVLLRFFRRRMVDILLKTSPLFTKLDDALRVGLAREFQFLEVDPGVGFIKQGKPVPGLFIILSGKARVTTTDKGRTRLLAELGPGDIVGEIALLTGQKSVVRVSAVTKCWMLFMSAKTFRQKAVLIPEVVSYLRDLWSERVRAAQTAGRQPVEFPVERLPVF